MKRFPILNILASLIVCLFLTAIGLGLSNRTIPVVASSKAVCTCGCGRDGCLCKKDVIVKCAR